MVDALTTIRDWLAPDGQLIDIHPTGEPPAITVRVGQVEYAAGWLHETRDDEKYVAATRALAEAVRCGVFLWEARTSLDFTYEADTLSDLHAFLEEKWHGATLEDRVSGQIESLLGLVSADDTPKAIVLRETIHLSALRGVDCTSI